MKHLKKLFTLVILLTIIIGSWTFARNLFTSDANIRQEVMQDRVHVGAESNPLMSPTKILKPTTTNLSSTTNVESEATNILLQSKDGGQTWQDISQGLPAYEQPEGFVAGESDLYLRVNNMMYHSKSDLSAPVWEQENFPDLENTSLAFNRSGVIAYNYEGKMYQRKSPEEKWLPVYPNLKKDGMRRIFETSDGTVFICYERGLYKSVDSGQSWKEVQNEGLVMDMVESEGVLLATGTKGIMRSTDNGDHWQWVISEGGVGIDVDRIEGGFAVISFSNITKSRRIRISLDNGKTWKAIDEGLQPSMSISSIKQVGNYLLCGHPDGIFRSSDMGKTWSMVHSSVDNAVPVFRNASNVSPSNDNRKVFKLFVSGHVVYALARNFGC